MKPSSQVNRRQLHQANSTQSSVATPVFGAVCATAILLAALVHRYARTQYGPCALDGTRRTVHCTRSSALSALPVEIPDTTLLLSFKNDSDPEGRLIENAFGTLQRSNFSRFRRLRDLGLVRCGVEHIEAMTFVDLSDLRRLDLRNNRLHHLAKATFGGISKLDLLLLSGNPLVELGANALSGLTVSRVEFVDNALLGRINELAFENSRISSVILNRCRLDRVETTTWKHLVSNEDHLETPGEQ
jgi:Leucine rich repeat